MRQGQGTARQPQGKSMVLGRRGCVRSVHVFDLAGTRSLAPALRGGGKGGAGIEVQSVAPPISEAPRHITVA
jgi:hypothetical protein